MISAAFLHCQSNILVRILGHAHWVSLPGVVVVHLCAVQELEAQLEEQRKLMQSVACRGEEILSQQTTPNGERCVLLDNGRHPLKKPFCICFL